MEVSAEDNSTSIKGGTGAINTNEEPTNNTPDTSQNTEENITTIEDETDITNTNEEPTFTEPVEEKVEEDPKDEPKQEPKQETKKEEYEFGKAGFFVTEEKGGKLNVIDKSKDYDSVLSTINGQLQDTYRLWYKPGMTDGSGREAVARLLYDGETNRYGLEISAWRKSYDSSYVSNRTPNAVLETFYYSSGDKEVSKALWDWFDAVNINGKENTTNFGFNDVRRLDNGFVIETNGIEVTVIKGNGYREFYFE